MLVHYVYTALGGALGAMSRLALSHMIPPCIAGLPLPTLCINILGSFLMGLLTSFMAYSDIFSGNMRYLLITGILGGFTTFSTFSLESGLLIEKNEFKLAMIYVCASVGLSLISFFLGVRLIRAL